MGQKIHPLGFRVGITGIHKSIWYTNINMYHIMLKEDTLIRDYLKKREKETNISNIKIERNTLNSHVFITIHAAKPGLLIGENSAGLTKISNDIRQFISKTRQLTVTICEIDETTLNAKLLANLIVEQLEKRIAFRRAIRDSIRKAQNQYVKGIKIQISGRLNGAEIARTEWVREGRVPLQTLKAPIDYATSEANTIYGVLGIKVWLYK